jgi:hypothetical protein
MERLYKKLPNGRYKEVDQELSLDEEIVLFCAFRYCLGRMTYVVSSCVSEYFRLSHLFSENFKYRTVTEIDEARDSDNLGMHMDASKWLLLRDFLDVTNRYSVEANYYNTDRWEEREAFLHNGLYYCISTRKELHTVRNIKNLNRKWN